MNTKKITDFFQPLNPEFVSNKVFEEDIVETSPKKTSKPRDPETVPNEIFDEDLIERPPRKKPRHDYAQKQDSIVSCMNFTLYYIISK